MVAQAAEFEDALEDNSSWEEGDWNGDGDFTSLDLVLAFQSSEFQSVDPPATIAAALADSELRSDTARTRSRQDDSHGVSDELLDAIASPIDSDPAVHRLIFAGPDV